MDSEKASQIEQTDEFTKEGFNLYPSDGSSETFFAEGKNFRISNQNPVQKKGEKIKYNAFKMLQWNNPSQFNAFLTSPLDIIYINVILDSKEVQTGKPISMIIGRQ